MGGHGVAAALSDQLARAETELADLTTTRKTLTGEPETTDPADTTIASVVLPADPRRVHHRHRANAGQ